VYEKGWRMPRRTLRVAAPAKVNLFLSVGGRRADGFHELDTVFHALDLFDRLVVEVFDARPGLPEFSLVGDLPSDCSPSDNLVYRAYLRARSIAPLPAGQAVRVRVDKRIPLRSGLGGGSSDAAGMLLAHARLVGADVHSDSYLRAAADLGADVAFFLQGGCARMTGRGERLAERFEPLALSLVVTSAGTGVSTAAAYRRFDEDPQPFRSSEPLVSLLREGSVDPDDLAAACWNDLAPAARFLNVQVDRELRWLSDQPEALAACMTGSGDACFAFCEDAARAARLAARAREQGLWACATRLASSGVRLDGDAPS